MHDEKSNDFLPSVSDYLLIASVNILGGTVFGLMLGSTEPFYNLKYTAGLWNSGFNKSVWSIAFLLGAAPVSLIGGHFADRIGYRQSILLSTVFLILGVLFSLLADVLFSPSTLSYWLIITGRFIAGGFTGVLISVCPSLVENFTPTPLKHTFGMFFQLSVCNAILLASGVFSLVSAFMTHTNTPTPTQLDLITHPPSPHTQSVGLRAMSHTITTLPAIPAALLCVCTWRMFQRAALHPSTQPLTAIINSNTPITQPHSTRLPVSSLVLGIIMGIATQFSGINAVVFFSADILSFLPPQMANLVFATFNLLAVVAAIVLASYIAEHIMFLVSIGLVAVWALWLALGFGLTGHASPTTVQTLKLIGLIGFVSSFELGLGPLFFSLAPRIFPLWFRARGCAAACSAQSIGTIIVPFVFAQALHEGVPQWVLWLCFGLASLVLLVPNIVLLGPALRRYGHSAETV